MFKTDKIYTEYKNLEVKCASLKVENELYKEKNENLERDSRHNIQDKDDEIRRLNQNIEFEVLKKTKSLTDENQTLKIDKEKAQNKVAILEKAFENLGFDVKDMKEILGKLVDGIISKNEVKLIQSK